MELIISVGSLVVSLIVAYYGWRKLRPERMSLDASAANEYMEAAQRAAVRLNEMQAQFDIDKKAMMTRLDGLEVELANVRTQLREATDRAAKFENWARRLSGQVVSLGGTPVPLEVEAK